MFLNRYQFLLDEFFFKNRNETKLDSAQPSLTLQEQHTFKVTITSYEHKKMIKVSIFYSCNAVISTVCA